MAIVLEEEKKSVDWGFMLGIVLILGIVGTAVVYLFFISPETTQQLLTPDQQTLSEFSKAKFNPDAVFNSPGYQALRQGPAIPQITPDQVGKSNPFVR